MERTFHADGHLFARLDWLNENGVEITERELDTIQERAWEHFCSTGKFYTEGNLQFWFDEDSITITILPTTYTLYDRAADSAVELTEEVALDLIRGAGSYAGPWGGMGARIDQYLGKFEDDEPSITAVRYRGRWLIVPDSQVPFVSHELSCAYEPLSLEEIFDSCDWERKFEYQVPDSDIAAVFRRGQEADLEAYLAENPEETEDVCRAIFLGSDSAGQVVCITEEAWEDDAD